MRIALVCPYAWDRVGGVQSHIRSLSDALRARGHTVLVVAPSVGKVRSEAGVTIAGRAVPIPANGSVAPLSFGPVAATALRRALKDFEPEVLHLHEPLIPSLSLLALMEAAWPAVGTFHAAAESSAGYKLARPVLDKAARKLKVRTAVSSSAKALAATYFPGDFVMTPNGVDTERFATAESLEVGDPDIPKVLFLSRLEKRKGLEILIDAIARLDDLDTELVIAGSGPEEKSARSLAKSRGVPAHFLGRVEHDDVPRLYKAATVYCAPGTGGESFGIVLIEAMAAGAPIVCSDLPGFREVAAGPARLVPPGDPAALANALRSVLSDETERARMREDGTDRARLFDWQRLVRDVERLYEHAVRAS